MKIKFFKYLLILVYSIHLQSNGQHVEDANSIESRALSMFYESIEEGEINESTLLYWQEKAENPINLNQTNRQELTDLSLLSASQIERFLHYRTIFGSLSSIYELQAVPGFDLEVIKNILPFVVIESSTKTYSKPLLKRIITGDNHYIITRVRTTLEDKSGYRTSNDNIDSPKYLGSPQALLIKYRSSHAKDFSIGFTLEKDAGERLNWKPSSKQFLFNFHSYHITLKNKGRLKNITLGDYKLQFGQGLLYGAGFSPGKGSRVIESIKRNHAGIVSYSSAVESNFMRGLALSYTWKRFVISPFLSTNKRSASLEIVDNNSSITSIYDQGLFRTPTELKKLKTFNEHLAGVNLHYKSTSSPFTFSYTFSHQQFNVPISKSDEAYKIYNWDGSSLRYHSMASTYHKLNTLLFTELAIGSNNSKGLLVGLVNHASKYVHTSLLIRYYSPDFTPLQNASFSENSKSQNEFGIYSGIRIPLTRKLELNGYIDAFRFPWLKFRVDRPSLGHEYLLSAQLKQSRSTILKLTYKQEEKGINQNRAAPLKSVGPKNKQLFQLSFEHKTAKILRFKTNIQSSSIRFDGLISRGFSISHQVDISWRSVKWSGSVILFDSDNHDNRHYRYERDVLYALSLPALSGEGFRYYTLIQFNLLRSITAWIKFSRTTFLDRNEIGSGTESIDGNTKSDLSIQLRYRF